MAGTPNPNLTLTLLRRLRLGERVRLRAELKSPPSLDPQCLVKLSRKLRDIRDNPGRLFGKRVGDPLAHFRLEFHQLRGRNDQGKVIIDVMPHVRQFDAQISNLLRRQRYGVGRQSHAETMR